MSRQPLLTMLRRFGDLTVGSWRRTLVSGALIVVVFAAVVAGATRLDLRHASFPGHPYPPPGFYANPFSTDPDDLLSTADAARVRASFQQDGQLELDAFARGDATGLDRADAGGRLSALRQAIAQNDAAGIVQRYDNHVDRVVVGRLAVPGTSSVRWCVEERGTATLTDVSRAGGQSLRTQRYRFDGRFWLTGSGASYLITDAAITNTPLSGR